MYIAYIYIYIFNSFIVATGKKCTSDVRETGACRHNGGPIEGPLKTPSILWFNDVSGVSGGPQWSPMMPRGTSLTGYQPLKTGRNFAQEVTRCN